MSRMQYWFELTRNGDPVPGSNIKSTRPPKSSYKRWKKMLTLAEVCCDTTGATELEQSEGRKRRYWVRNDENNLPISGTLMESKQKPSLGNWMEVVGNYCCGDIYSPTIDEDLDVAIDEDGAEFNILEEGNAVDPQGATVTVIPVEDLDSDEENMSITVDNEGNVVVTLVDDAEDAVGTFTLTMTDGKGHKKEFTFTVTYTAP